MVWAAAYTPENCQHLGSSSTQHRPLPWPPIRATCLMDRQSHELHDAQLGGMDCGELSLATKLQGEDRSLALFDRAYFSAAFLLGWQAAGEQRHRLMRATENLHHELIEQLSPSDALIRMPLSQRTRQLQPKLQSQWPVRLIDVALGARRRRFITSLHDHRAYPARALAERHRQCIEIELGFREIKGKRSENNTLSAAEDGMVRAKLRGGGRCIRLTDITGGVPVVRQQLR